MPKKDVGTNRALRLAKLGKKTKKDLLSFAQEIISDTNILIKKIDAGRHK